MEPFGRQPPRYVPTLTDVVAEGLPIRRPAESAQGAAQPLEGQQQAHDGEDELAAPTAPEMPAAQVHEALVARLLERVQPMLEAQLRDAVAEVMQSHAEVLVRSLRVAAEDVVRAAVADAIVQEHSAALRK